ncbi:Uma2 family endonuclease [Desulfobacterales bacterium HSG2]|nr:Uma2 family endonuclease [Desulfobacterales bacterium HSG2]
MGTAIRSVSEFPDHTLYDDDVHTEDEYYYGYRTIIEYDENGETSFRYRPLTLEDFLEPEEGDVYMQGNVHEEDVGRLKSIFRYHLRNREDVAVYSDMKIIWGIGNLENPAPDISVIENVRDPKESRSSFYVPDEGVKPSFVLEVVSPRYRKSDFSDKPEIYRKAGVSEYVIIDPGLKNKERSYTISGYRMFHGRYVEMSPDHRGRLHSVTTGVRIGMSESGDRIIVYDAYTDEEILSDDERAEQEKRLAEQEKARADLEKRRADLEKRRAEQEKNRAEQEKNRAELAENRAELAEDRAELAENRVELAEDRADSAEKEIMRLKAHLKAMGISAG